MSLFQQGNFKLHSGAATDWKIECDALDDQDWQTLAMLIVDKYNPVSFGGVTGVPTGGLKLADALQPYTNPYSENHLIVDDVYTTGTSMNKLRATIKQPGMTYIGAVVFARGPIIALDKHWIMPLFQMRA